ncbi:SH3 domain-containing protein [Exiguobacterium aurantiacum]|uniref:SH3 domain-containing protein n=1 Tax=Exiguobacterium aurantiacum TaxID=33987 RepID=A0ABY5FTW7_9BACL|nr:SH3 domain-containing protein [Exiguobacterium aurantiacum]UTT44568.1 SH3 domain-containing protein [Exiguobacterium aurantiacum]
MNTLKKITAGILCLTLLSGLEPKLLPISETNSTVEASVQTKVMYANAKTDAYDRRSTKKSKRVISIPYGARVERLAVYSSWSQVRYNNKVGWVASRALVEIKKVEVYDAKQNVTVYDSRSTKGKVVTKVPANKQVTRLAVNKSWSQIRYGSKTGWVASSKLKHRYTKETFAPKKYRVKVSAPLQSSALTTSKILNTIPEYSVIESVERHNEWLKITYNKQTGWIQNKYLKTYKAETTLEIINRVYGTNYDIEGTSYTFTIATKGDKEGYDPKVELDVNSIALNEINGLSSDKMTKEYTQAAKLFTTIHGGNAEKLSSKMLEVFNNGPYNQYIRYDKFEIKCDSSDIFIILSAN